MTGSVCRKRVRVLVVDDNPLVRDMLGDFVRVAGYDVTVSAEGVDAVTRLTEERYDVLLTDIKMPAMDGWQLIALATRFNRCSRSWSLRVRMIRKTDSALRSSACR
jgi:CheY-like chemotaxis protein